MSKKRFDKDALEELKKLPANTYLRKEAADKYADFAKYDPFPDIPPALLNSVDIIKYALTTGMIYEFKPEDLDGATYTCRFSGKYAYMDYPKNSSAQKKWRRGILNEGEELTLQRNSIMFLEVETDFRIPIYMVARFNIKVFNAYKGVLLGTGPIVDPGFNGRLFIPLHNLTSNEYVIKKDAKLISVEFTKLSVNKGWYIGGNKNLHDKVKGLDFTQLSYVKEEREAFRGIDEYIEKALGDKLFYKKGEHNRPSDELTVGSSIPEAVKEAKDKAKAAEKSVRTVRNWTIAAALAIVFAVFSLINDINARIDNVKQLERIQSEYADMQLLYEEMRDTYADYNLQVEKLQKEHDDLSEQANTTKADESQAVSDRGDK